jgi:hypothetical protein
MCWPLQMPANPSHTIGGRKCVGGGSLERDGHPWFATFSLTHHVGVLLMTAEDLSSFLLLFGDL